MNILHVLPYPPVPADYGAKIRIYNIMKHLSRNHQLSVVFIGSDAQAADLRHEFGGRLGKIIACPVELTGKIRGLAHLRSFLGSHTIIHHFAANRFLHEKVVEEIVTGWYDVVLTEFPFMAFFDIPPGPMRVLNGHNIEYDNFRRMTEKSDSWFKRMIYANEARKCRPEELDAFRRQDLLLFTSERDRLMACADVPEVPSVVVPNGVDATYFRPPDSTHEPCSMVFTGTLGYAPNADGVAWFLEEIFPRIAAKEPRAKVTIVGADAGRRLLRLASPVVRFTGYVDDVRPYVYASDVSVVPLRMGGGTRLKIIESFAMMSPVVSTPIGAEGIDLVDGEHALIAGDPQAFADAVLRLFADRELRGDLARHAHRLMLEKYEWSVIGAGLEKVLHDAVNGHGSRKGRHVR